MTDNNPEADDREFCEQCGEPLPEELKRTDDPAKWRRRLFEGREDGDDFRVHQISITAPGDKDDGQEFIDRVCDIFDELGLAGRVHYHPWATADELAPEYYRDELHDVEIDAEAIAAELDDAPAPSFSEDTDCGSEGVGEPTPPRTAVQVDGEPAPAFQVDVIDGEVFAHLDVVEAVEAGFDFSNVWRCKRVTVTLRGHTFDADVQRCEIEHGVAALVFSPVEDALKTDFSTLAWYSSTHAGVTCLRAEDSPRRLDNPAWRGRFRPDGGDVDQSGDASDRERFEHKQRVKFIEAYDGMAEELDVLVGDAGFVVNPSNLFNIDDKALVQFDENKTGRPGGERHWIPTDHLEPEHPQHAGTETTSTDSGEVPVQAADSKPAFEDVEVRLTGPRGSMLQLFNILSLGLDAVLTVAPNPRAGWIASGYIADGVLDRVGDDLLADSLADIPEGIRKLNPEDLRELIDVQVTVLDGEEADSDV